MTGKVAFAVVLVLLLLSGCQQAAVVNVEAEKEGVAGVLGAYIESVEQENMEQYATLVSHDSSMVNFGAFGEPIIGWEALQEVMRGQNDALSDIDIEASDVNIEISPSGTWARATSLWKLKAVAGANKLELPVRCTWFLEKEAGGWVITHFHKSVAAG